MKNNRIERLKLVFPLKPKFESEKIEMGKSTVVWQARNGEIAPVEALQMLNDIMQQLGMEVKFKTQEKTISTTALLTRVAQTGKWTQIESNNLSFQFGAVGLYDHSFILIEEQVAGAAICWDRWVKPFLAAPGFVQAWVSDVEYDHWQNAKDILEYTAVGRDYSQLPMISNGLPPPLEQKIIDTTNNPGRWSLQSGYVEAIGATMWLGDSFWERVGADRKERVKSVNWLNVETVNDNTLHVRASENSFSDQRTAEVQNKLRAILYGT
ncbi:hypothetical protein ACO0LM_15875 [Undibacterium sp. Di26W]|uniref:hypothetical protein n=1 Tax=Undibacterium sp. Di26W TaxID=3413035 RepID=UPI003BF3903D